MGNFNNLIQKPFILGDFFPGHSEEVAGGKYFALVKPNANGQYDNFVQFAGQKDGTTRCAQIVQLLLANHVDHDVFHPLVAVQLEAFNAFCSVSRQPQFDVLAGKASRSYDNGRVQVGDEPP